MPVHAGGSQLESSSVEDSKWNMSQQYALVANRTSSVLGYIRRSIAGRSREGIFPPQVSPGEATAAVLCPVLGSPVQQKYGAAGESQAEGHEEDR